MACRLARVTKRARSSHECRDRASATAAATMRRRAGSSRRKRRILLGRSSSPSNSTACTPSSNSPSYTHGLDWSTLAGGRLHSSSVVPDASTSKKRVPTIFLGPVVLTQILVRASWAAYALRLSGFHERASARLSMACDHNGLAHRVLGAARAGEADVKRLGCRAKFAGMLAIQPRVDPEGHPIVRHTGPVRKLVVAGQEGERRDRADCADPIELGGHLAGELRFPRVHLVLQDDQRQAGVCAPIKTESGVLAVDVAGVVRPDDRDVGIEAAARAETQGPGVSRRAHVMEARHGSLNVAIVAPLLAIVVRAIFNPQYFEPRWHEIRRSLIKAEQARRQVGSAPICG
eukprot:scaffold2267_cov112-Isochrysis_galbana.AAC.2